MKDDSKNFEILKYPNGTHTLVDSENQQAMHSRIGPEEEAGTVYADRAKIEAALLTSDSTHVLYDVGMGTGMNVVAALERIRAAPSSLGKLGVYSFETKPEGLALALENLEQFPALQAWEKSLRELLEVGSTRFEIGKVEVEWKLLVGDFYSQIASAPPPDTLFFDFYSPRVVPELWSLGNFKILRTKIGKHPALFYTYAAATFVRLHFLSAGFYVGSGIPTPMKYETTVVSTTLAALENPLPASWLRKLETSTSIAGPEYAEARALVLVHPQFKN